MRGRETFQGDLGRLKHWAITSCMEFNNDKYYILHQGSVILDVCIDLGSRGWNVALQKGS